MISSAARKHADKCRFCWMCRHLCPIQLKTGKEINTPRAKGLLLSNVTRGKTYDADMAKAMYECLLCDACSNDCATGYEPPLFIREARTEAIVNGLAPQTVQTVIRAIKESGTIYGTEKTCYGNDVQSDILLYLGEVAAVKVPGMVSAVENLLNKAGVLYTVLDEEPVSGVMLSDLMGDVEEVRIQAKRCADAIKASGAKTVIALDSYDAVMMLEKYPEFGCEVEARVVTAVSYIADLVREGRLSVCERELGKAAYHDDDRSARRLMAFDSGRELMDALGYERVEMFNHLKLAKSCGTSVAKAYMPEIIQKVAEGRWEDLLRTEADVMVVSNPEAYECLTDAVPGGKKLVDIFEMLDQAVMAE